MDFFLIFPLFILSPNSFHVHFFFISFLKLNFLDVKICGLLLFNRWGLLKVKYRRGAGIWYSFVWLLVAPLCARCWCYTFFSHPQYNYIYLYIYDIWNSCRCLHIFIGDVIWLILKNIEEIFIQLKKCSLTFSVSLWLIKICSDSWHLFELSLSVYNCRWTILGAYLLPKT